MTNQRFKLKIKEDGPGAADVEQTCKDLINKYVEVGGTLGGGRKLSVQGTISGTSWFTLVANIVTPGGLFAIPQNVLKIRMNTDVLGSGPTTAYLLGFNAETSP